MRQIVTLFQGWKGSFMSFCQTLRQHHRLNYGATFIGNLLHCTGLRARRPRKSKEPPWGEKTFRGLFPGAQWLADGTTMAVQGIDVVWGGRQFKFNLEVILDAACNAIVGLSVSDSEDQDALLRAFEDAVSTTGKAALALSADNRPSNHTEVVRQGLGETALLATTPGRGQSKAPLEGTLGLFKQALPEINVSGADPREQARRVLELVFTAWARGRNGRPRLKLGKKSPAQYYQDSTPTAEQLETANQWFQELRRRQEQFRKTRAERADQAKLAFLQQGLTELGIQDPDGRLAVNLAYYSRDSIINGLAIFEAKRSLGNLPPGVDEPRYLGGIIRNEDSRVEFELEAELFLRNRQRLRDLSLDVLVAKAAPSEGHPPKARFRIFLERALKAERAIDYHFWATKTLELLRAFDSGHQREAYDYATRRISTAFRASRDRRIALLSRLSSACTEA